MCLKQAHGYARVAQLVERDLAKVEAAGSSPVSRSIYPVELRFYGAFSLYKRIFCDRIYKVGYI